MLAAFSKLVIIHRPVFRF